MKFNFKLEHLVILGLFIYVVFLSTCNSKPIDPKIITKEVVRVDSIHTTDTIVQHHTKYISNVPQLVNIPHTPFNIDLTDTNVFNDTFYYGIKDSLLEATILVHGESKPDSIGFDYDLKTFTIRDSIYIRDSVYVKEQILKSYLSAGASIYGGNSFGFIPTIFYNHKTGNNFGLGYDLFNKNIHITYSKRLKLK